MNKQESGDAVSWSTGRTRTAIQNSLSKHWEIHFRVSSEEMLLLPSGDVMGLGLFGERKGARMEENKATKKGMY